MITCLFEDKLALFSKIELLMTCVHFSCFISMIQFIDILSVLESNR